MPALKEHCVLHASATDKQATAVINGFSYLWVGVFRSV